MDGLADVGIDAPSLLDGRDDGGKVVVGEDHVRRTLGHVGARPAHGTADVRRFQGRGIVHPVPCHGHDVPPLLQGLDDTGLVFRGHPGKDGGMLHRPLQLLPAHPLQLRPRQNLVPRTAQVQSTGHGGGGGPVIPGDHHRAHPRHMTPGHGGPGLWPGRVHQAEQPQKGQLLLRPL